MIILAYSVWNMLAFISMWLDKGYARRGARRISERTFFVWGTFFGAAGIWLGMYVFRHKTRQRRFTVGMPILVVWNGIIAFYLWLLH